MDPPDDCRSLDGELAMRLYNPGTGDDDRFYQYGLVNSGGKCFAILFCVGYIVFMLGKIWWEFLSKEEKNESWLGDNGLMSGDQSWLMEPMTLKFGNKKEDEKTSALENQI